MSKLKELRKVKRIVEEILETNREARNDDYYLFALVLEKYEEILKIPVLSTSLEDYLTNPLYIDYPRLETVSRARRKAQQLKPWLASDRRVEKARFELQADYIDFAKEVE